MGYGDYGYEKIIKASNWVTRLTTKTISTYNIIPRYGIQDRVWVRLFSLVGLIGDLSEFGYRSVPSSVEEDTDGIFETEY